MASVTLRTKPVSKKGFALYLDIYNEGLRYKEYLKLYVSKDYTRHENRNVFKHDKDSWELANSIHAKRLLQVKESASGFIPKMNKQDFIKYYKEKALIKNHGTYDNALCQLLTFIKTDRLAFKTINENFLRSFIKFLRSQTLSVTTIRLYLSRLHIVLNLAVAEKIIQVNPFIFLKRGKGGDIPPKKQKRIEFLTIEELRKLKYSWYRDDIQEYFFFSCFTGLRESDLLKLRWTDINEAAFTYTQKKQQDSIVHYLPLSKQALDLLKQIERTQKHKLRKIDEYVFTHLPARRTILWNLKKWAIEAGIDKNIHIHVARHTWATLALTNGVSLYTVSKMLGHSSIAVTQVYAEVIDEVKQKAAELMPML